MQSKKTFNLGCALITVTFTRTNLHTCRATPLYNYGQTKIKHHVRVCVYNLGSKVTTKIGQSQRRSRPLNRGARSSWLQRATDFLWPFQAAEICTRGSSVQMAVSKIREFFILFWRRGPVKWVCQFHKRDFIFLTEVFCQKCNTEMAGGGADKWVCPFHREMPTLTKDCPLVKCVSERNTLNFHPIHGRFYNMCDLSFMWVSSKGRNGKTYFQALALHWLTWSIRTSRLGPE